MLQFCAYYILSLQFLTSCFQGLLQLVEPEATIKCRAEDYELVKVGPCFYALPNYTAFGFAVILIIYFYFASNLHDSS